MSTIPISELLPVKTGVIDASINTMSMAGLVLTDNQLIPNNKDARVLKFISRDQIGKYFGYDSPEYINSEYYFNGFDGSTKSPDFILFGRWIGVDQNAYIRSGAITENIAKFQLITDGKISFIYNSTQIDVTNINLSTAKGYSDIAALLQLAIINKIPDSEVKYDSLQKAFVITFSATSGSADVIDYCLDTELSILLKLTKSLGGILSQGSVGQSPAENMDAIVGVTENWVISTNLMKLSSDDLDGLMSWVSSRNTGTTSYSFVPYSDESNGSLTNTQVIAQLLQTKKYTGITPVYGYVRHALFVLGTSASIDYTSNNGTLTFAFKHQAGLDVTVSDKDLAQKLKDLGFNFYGNYGTKAKEFTWFENGVISGQCKFIDNFINQVWLLDQLQAAEAELFDKNKAIGYDATGDNDLFTTFNSVMLNARDVGVCSKGIRLSDEQKIQLRNLLGFDPSNDIYSNGYFIYLPAPKASDRADRKRPATMIFYAYRGAVHFLPLNLTLIV